MTSSHNTLNLEGQNQSLEFLEAGMLHNEARKCRSFQNQAFVVGKNFAESVSYIASDAHRCYEPALKAFVRRIWYVRPDYFVIWDHIDGSNTEGELNNSINVNQYDGKTYHFNKAVVDAYDKTISALSNKGMTVTVILLNDWNPNTPDLIYPGTQKSSNAFYYMFNAETESGFEQTKAIASFLADHYSGSNSSYGKVSNWIIGNEINNQQWNYMGATDLTSYVKAYQKAFRVIYTAIKSTNANDRVYFSLDYNWMNEIDGKLKYGGKQIVDSFNSIANTEGQMDWGLAYHPYPCPMTEPEFWDDPQTTGLFTNDFNSPVINFANLNVLTDYFVQETLRTPSGHVRHIILTEQGFTSYSPTRGNIPEIQAAAYAYSYYLVDSNPYIDAYTVSRQVDAPSEAKDGLKFGLWECDMNQPNLIVATKRKKIWQVFRDIDKKNSTLEATEFAKSIIGISKWSDVIPNFKWRNLEN